MGRTFTGDYSTGKLKQWGQIQNVFAATGSESSASYIATGYPLSIVSDDKDAGYVARMEVRPGDTPGGGSNNERSEVAGNTSAINVTRWEAFSIKFDPTFPINGATDNGWAITNQWPDASGLFWNFQVPYAVNNLCLDGATPSGYWTLSAAGPGSTTIRLLDVPMDRGNWIDVKMHIGWYDSGSGFVKVWINGVRQTLRYTSFSTYAAGDTYNGRTVWNNSSGTFYYKEGLYRATNVGYPTGIIYHANYRTATTEDGL